jgi:hypothetical protein
MSRRRRRTAGEPPTTKKNTNKGKYKKDREKGLSKKHTKVREKKELT